MRWGVSNLKNLGTYGIIKGARQFIIGTVKKQPKAIEDYGYCMENNILTATGTDWRLDYQKVFPIDHLSGSDKLCYIRSCEEDNHEKCRNEVRREYPDDTSRS